MQYLVFVVLGLLLAAPVSGLAQQPTTVQPARLEVTPFVGLRLGGTFTDETSGRKLELDDGLSAGILLNWRDSSRTEWEIGWSHQATKVSGVDNMPAAAEFDIDIDYLQIGGTYLGNGKMAKPYMVATLGAAFLDPVASDFGSDTFFAFSIGGGVKLFPERRFGLRLEGRFYGTVIDSDSKIFCSSSPQASGCLISTKGEVIWQWEMLVGGIVRF